MPGFNPNAYQVGPQAPAAPGPGPMGPPAPAPQMGPPKPPVTAETRLADAMRQLGITSQQEAEAAASYQANRDMIQQLGSMREIAPNWMGAAAAGIRGYLMRKNMKEAKASAQAQGEAALNKETAAQLAQDARADIKHQRDLELEAMRMAQKGATPRQQSEWQFRANGFMLEQKLKNGQPLTDAEQMQLGAFRDYMGAKRENAYAAGGNPLPGFTNMPKPTRNKVAGDIVTGTGQQAVGERILAMVDDDMFGLGNDLRNAVQGVSQYVGDGLIGASLDGLTDAFSKMPEGEREVALEKKRQLQSTMRRLTNQILLERSGAAVTAPEFERFKKEFPVGRFTSRQEFVTKMEQFIVNLEAERDALFRSGEWTLEQGQDGPTGRVIDRQGNPVPVAPGASLTIGGKPESVDYSELSDEQLLSGDY